MNLYTLDTCRVDASIRERRRRVRQRWCAILYRVAKEGLSVEVIFKCKSELRKEASH